MFPTGGAAGGSLGGGGNTAQMKFHADGRWGIGGASGSAISSAPGKYTGAQVYKNPDGEFMINTLTSNSFKFSVNGTSLFHDKIAFTQTDGNEYIDSLADGYMDYGATTQHRFNNDVDVDGDITADSISAVHKAADGTAAVADGTYTVGIGTSTNGTITIQDGIITAITEAT